MPNTLISVCNSIMNIWQIPALIILLMSFISFCLYGIDKWKAQHNRWRISEKTLLLSAVLFGGIGAFLGMRIFRHKTKHWYFAVLVPLFTVLQIMLAISVAVIGLDLL